MSIKILHCKCCWLYLYNILHYITFLHTFFSLLVNFIIWVVKKNHFHWNHVQFKRISYMTYCLHYNASQFYFVKEIFFQKYLYLLPVYCGNQSIVVSFCGTYNIKTQQYVNVLYVSRTCIIQVSGFNFVSIFIFFDFFLKLFGCRITCCI